MEMKRGTRRTNEGAHKGRRTEIRIRRFRIQIGTYIIIDSSVDAVYTIWARGSWLVARICGAGREERFRRREKGELMYEWRTACGWERRGGDEGRGSRKQSKSDYRISKKWLRVCTITIRTWLFPHFTKALSKGMLVSNNLFSFFGRSLNSVCGRGHGVCHVSMRFKTKTLYDHMYRHIFIFKDSRIWNHFHFLALLIMQWTNEKDILRIKQYCLIYLYSESPS